MGKKKDDSVLVQVRGIKTGDPFVKEVEFDLTQDELVGKGDHLSRMIESLRHIEEEKKEMADRFKRQIVNVEEEITKLARIVREKKEFRDAEVKWEYYFDTNVKRLIIIDTGVVVQEAPIDDHERQLMLDPEGIDSGDTE